jgi:hypothetical protein
VVTVSLCIYVTPIYIVSSIFLKKLLLLLLNYYLLAISVSLHLYICILHDTECDTFESVLLRKVIST